MHLPKSGCTKHSAEIFERQEIKVKEPVNFATKIIVIVIVVVFGAPKAPLYCFQKLVFVWLHVRIYILT